MNLPQPAASQSRQTVLLGFLLALLTLALYWPATTHSFILLDDPAYVSGNPHVTDGITLADVKWAFTSGYAANWHPLTWISHQLDCSMYGLYPGGHHLTNIFLHALNTLLLFLALNRLTKSICPSALVAALFGWHPLHVESVAWVAERKDVLSTFFLMLTLLAYALYAEATIIKTTGGKSTQAQVDTANENLSSPSPREERVGRGPGRGAPLENSQEDKITPLPNPLPIPSSWGEGTRLASHADPVSSCARSKLWYGVTFGCFVLGLMSKPMLVTLPFVLLLLDYWPLKRIADCGLRIADLENPNAKDKSSSWLPLVVEKIPFFALALAACVVTLLVQHAAGAVRSVSEVPFGLRLLNVTTAYARYAGRTFWPVNLSVYYLLPSGAPLVPAVAAGLGLAVVTWLVFRWRVTRPWLMVGWFWFLGTLVPVIGFVQVGSQAMADRYTYIPLIGLFIAVVWDIRQGLGGGRAARVFGGAVAIASLAACALLTQNQLGFWRDDVSLWQRAASVTPDNYFAEYELGTALAEAGRTSEAIKHHEASLQINPAYEPAHYHLGLELETAGRLDEAATQFLAALARDPTSEQLHNDLGVVRAQQGQLDAAVVEFKRAMELNPGYASAYLNYGNALSQLGETGPALANYRKARELDPASPQVLEGLALLLATASDAQWRNVSEAVTLAEKANELTQRQSPECLSTLAIAYAAAGNFPKAVVSAEMAQELAREQKLPEMLKRLEQDLAAYRKGQVSGK
jgi:tetratricopeptide (TPR) repeat protein